MAIFTFSGFPSNDAIEISVDTLLSDADKAVQNTIAKGNTAVLSGKKYDIVICDDDPDSISDWQDNLKDVPFASLLKNNARGYPIYIGGKTGYFDKTSSCSLCFDRPELDEDLQKFDNATQGDIDFLNGWMLQNNISYEMEGYIGCYQVSTKAELINLLKSCPIINDIYEVDEDGQIIQIY